MSAKSIVCSNCGARETQSIGLGKYQCGACDSIIEIFSDKDSTHKHDLITHRCYCGRPVSTNKSYKCMMCHTEDICEKHIEDSEDGMICNRCYKETNSNKVRQYLPCVSCGITKKTITCGSCSTLYRENKIAKMTSACFEHLELNFLTDFKIMSDYDKKEYCYIKCPKCHFICKNCLVGKKGLFKSEYTCKNCNSEIEFTSNEYDSAFTSFLIDEDF